MDLQQIIPCSVNEFMETQIGFNVLSTANDHIWMQVLLEWCEPWMCWMQLEDHFGTYRSEEEQNEILIIEKNGLEVAFLSYTMVPMACQCQKIIW
ncbi:CapA family protein [Chakrabartyella piscis]|uniref:CapA family protein n=1 Tax=Chakrabartyella piscis TaxID=2918914 RepID=UPI003A7F57DB